jgi:hypothetical protein
MGNKLSLDERISFSDGFVNDIKEMGESGLSIIAIAVALD